MKAHRFPGSVFAFYLHKFETECFHIYLDTKPTSQENLKNLGGTKLSPFVTTYPPLRERQTPRKMRICLEVTSCRLCMLMYVTKGAQNVRRWGRSTFCGLFVIFYVLQGSQINATLYCGHSYRRTTAGKENLGGGTFDEGGLNPCLFSPSR